MPLGIALDGMTPMAEMVDLTRRAEAAGLPSVWVAEHIGYRDGLASSMALLAATRRVRVAPAAISVYSRHPMISAMTAATLEEYAPGRTMFTLATGNPRAHGREMGLALSRPLAVTREYVAVLRGLWSGRPLTYAGEFFRMTDATFYVPPARPIPLLLAAMGPRMLELAGEMADGAVFSAGLSPAWLRRCLDLVGRGAQRAGRPPKSVATVAIVIAAVGRDRGLARRHARAFVAYGVRNRYIAENVAASGVRMDLQAAADAAARGDWEAASRLVPDDAVDTFALAGTPADCRDGLSRFLVDGLHDVVLLPVGDADARRLALDLAASV